MLYKILIPGESPWDIERNGSKRSKNMDEKFYSISIDYRKTPPIIDKHIIVKGEVLRDAYDLLNADGVSVTLHLEKESEHKILLIWKNSWSIKEYLQSIEVVS